MTYDLKQWHIKMQLYNNLSDNVRKYKHLFFSFLTVLLYFKKSMWVFILYTSLWSKKIVVDKKTFMSQWSLNYCTFWVCYIVVFIAYARVKLSLRFVE